MVEGSAGAVWFGAPGFRVRDVEVVDGELVVEVETLPGVVVCEDCGARAESKDRRWVSLRDTPAGDVAVRVRWWKRIWGCPNLDCETRYWTEQRDLAGPKQVLTNRARRWALNRVSALEGSVASIARGFGVSWSTVWSAVAGLGTEIVDAAVRVGPVAMIGFDETVFSPAKRRRRRRFITAAVDVNTGQILDVFDGRDAKDLRRWLASQPREWLWGIKVVSVDPHEGYRNAITAPGSPISDAVIVVDPFHVVRLANAAITRCRQRIQQETLEHRGWKGDPLYDIRKLLLMGAERIDKAGWERLHAGLVAGDLNNAVTDCWVAKEHIRSIYQTTDPDQAGVLLDETIEWCTAPEAGPELRRLAKTLTRWRTEIIAHHHTGASNGPVEAANLLIKHVKRSGRGFRNTTNYRLRILLAGGQHPTCKNQPVTRLRTRAPTLAA